MRFIKFATTLLSLIALLTGAMDVVIGITGQANLGVGAAASAPLDPVLDSQIRFLGAVWLGLGLIQLVALRDLHRYGPILQLCFGILVLGGIGRALSLASVGLPQNPIGATFVIVALIIELLLVPVAWFALRAATGIARDKQAFSNR